eukprot:PhF_6_TR29234/c0_g1_i3/m.42790
MATKPRVLIVLDIDHTLKTDDTVFSSPPVMGMPEVVKGWLEKYDARVEIVTNRWAPMSLIGLGPESFLEEHYVSLSDPRVTLTQRPWYDIIGLLTRSFTNKMSRLDASFTPTPSLIKDGTTTSPLYDAVIFLGDDVEYDVDLYSQAAKRFEGKSKVFLVAIRRSESWGCCAVPPSESKVQTPFGTVNKDTTKCLNFGDTEVLDEFVAKNI